MQYPGCMSLRPWQYTGFFPRPGRRRLAGHPGDRGDATFPDSGPYSEAELCGALRTKARRERWVRYAREGAAGVHRTRRARAQRLRALLRWRLLELRVAELRQAAFLGVAALWASLGDSLATQCFPFLGFPALLSPLPPSS